MLKTRVIPVLQLKGKGLVKTKRFGDPQYIGDPINAVRIFNDKEVDEIIFLDIFSTIDKTEPNIPLISKIASEAFMPFGYGGGINNLEIARTILKLGAEKIVVNTQAVCQPNFISELANNFGNQSIIVSIDIKSNYWKKNHVYSHSGSKKKYYDPLEFAVLMEEKGAGELIINSIDRDGMMNGYDLNLISNIAKNVSIPVTALGGASKFNDFINAIKVGAHAVAAGSLFVFAGKNQGVLINYPDKKQLNVLYEVEKK